MSNTKLWWQKEVIYQIYPRSFQDSNNDGIGDLVGLISRLDYLQDLGIGALWLSPIYPSPMHDFGYDVSDYIGISPEFGTMEDFKKLLAEAHKRNIRILMDLVLNHTSDEHPWFKESKSCLDSPKRDWYIWHSGKTSFLRRPPNNWYCAFGGKAWRWDETTEQFYFHSFLKEQPDVNWRNKDLQQAMWQVIRFWLDLGVDGFRLDVVNWFIKDKLLRSNPKKLLGRRPYDRQIHLYDRNQPETLEIMEQIRSVVDEYPEKMTIGEVFTESPGDPDLVSTYYCQGKGLHMAFNFAFLYSPWQADYFARSIAKWEELLGYDLWPNYTLSNHDQPRAFSRYQKGKETIARAKVAAAMLLTLRGTPFVYYGEEIGMKNGIIPKNKIQDPVGKRYWPFHKGRDGERTPMQWQNTKNAGFSDTEPWLPLNPDYQEVNVEKQKEDKDSLFNWYKRLIQLRKQEPSLHSGSYEFISSQNNVLCYKRCLDKDTIFIALNFANQERAVSLPNKSDWQGLFSWQSILEDKIKLQNYGVIIITSRG